MDTDDGYILWTGIWKGAFHRSNSLYSQEFLTIRTHSASILSALGNAKGI